MKNPLSSLDLSQTSYQNKSTKCFYFFNNLSRSPDIQCFKICKWIVMSSTGTHLY